MHTHAVKSSSPNSLRSRADQWLSTADAALATLQQEQWRQTHPSANDWIADTASRSGYTVNAFRRHIRVAEFLRARTPAEAWPALLRQSPPFGTLELIQRLFDVAPEKADQLLPQAVRGELTFRALRALYQEAQQGVIHSDGKKHFANRSQKFFLHARSAIQKYQQDFFGALTRGIQIEWMTSIRGFPYAKPDLIAVGRRSDQSHPEFVDAFELKLFGADDSKHVLLKTLQQVSLMEGFFRQLWLIYPRSHPTLPTHEQHIQELSFHLLNLDMDSVGIALVADGEGNSPEDSAPEIRCFPKANPRPRYSKLLVDKHLRLPP